MLEVVIFFLLVSVYLYCLLGGADFGAGILELFSRRESKIKTRTLVTKAMAPIWEANHMWLIIAVVILFNGFPAIYSRISISLYIPLILLLAGIILRGTAFTFRHYDAIKDHSQEIYSKIFAYSSVMVSFFFGLLIGALVSGRIYTEPATFVEGYIFSWLNLFAISTGLFVTSLFAFVASVYLIGDTSDEQLRSEFILKAKRSTLIMIVLGGFVFAASLFEETNFAKDFISNVHSMLMIVLATICLPVLWKSLSAGLIWQSRIAAGTILFFIVGAFYVIYFPVIVVLADETNLTLYNSSAPEVTLTYLGWALIIGSVLIFPALYYLLKVFKLEKEVREEEL